MSNKLKYLGYPALFLVCFMLALIMSIPITLTFALLFDHLFTLSSMGLVATLLYYGTYGVCVLFFSYQLFRLGLAGITAIKQLRKVNSALLAKSIKANLANIILFAFCLIVALGAMYFIDVLLTPVYISSYMIGTLFEDVDGVGSTVTKCLILLIYIAILLFYATLLFQLISKAVSFANKR